MQLPALAKTRQKKALVNCRTTAPDTGRKMEVKNQDNTETSLHFNRFLIAA